MLLKQRLALSINARNYGPELLSIAIRDDAFRLCNISLLFVICLLSLEALGIPTWHI
ncbi:hypothetical protein ANAPRD1_00536 [Anaplasma phagocytophilum]|nr:hypothetical protein ANAPRD1_00536 [Anaplasma phagocytophilum]